MTDRWPGDSVVHVWHFELDSLPAHDHQHLVGTAERHRLSAIAEPLRRRRAFAAQAGLRLVLARYLGRSPETLAFTRGPGGKPMLEDRSKLCFSLTRSGPFALCAVARDRAVGVDLELARPLPEAGDLCRTLLPPATAELVTRLPVARQAGAFLTLWTRMEALGKADGSGIAAGRALLAEHVGCGLVGEQRWHGPIGPFWVQDLELAPGRFGAVAMRSSEPVIRSFGFPEKADATLFGTSPARQQAWARQEARGVAAR